MKHNHRVVATVVCTTDSFAMSRTSKGDGGEVQCHGYAVHIIGKQGRPLDPWQGSEALLANFSFNSEKRKHPSGGGSNAHLGSIPGSAGYYFFQKKKNSQDKLGSARAAWAGQTSLKMLLSYLSAKIK